jgi:hypothetical protein
MRKRHNTPNKPYLSKITGKNSGSPLLFIRFYDFIEFFKIAPDPQPIEDLPNSWQI